VITLKNDTITLRAPEPEDLDFLYDWENDQRLWETGNTQTPLSRFILREYIKTSHQDIYHNRQLRLMICLNSDLLKPIGAVDLFDFEPFHLRAGVGILLKKEFQGKGLAKQTLALLLEYATFHLGLHQLYANVTENNEVSRHLFESLGFEKCSEKKHWTRVGAIWYNEILYQKILINKDL
jgi:diamine N-acetyltransferase